MVIVVDEKPMDDLPPPPPYWAAGSAVPPPFPNQSRRSAGFSTLPAHLLLNIVYATFPRRPGFDESRMERQRKTLYWLCVSLRLVNRALYIACMHVLRSTYLSPYQSLIRPPYTSDPFPFTTSTSTSTGTSSSPSPLQRTQRETAVLDHFIALKVREDVWADDTELHLEREESFKDLFELMQPQSRLEDLVREYGIREGVITVSAASSSNSSGTRDGAVPFSALSVSFSTRKARLVLSSKGGKRTIVEVLRTREEKLEVAAKKLVKELKVWLKGHSYSR